MSSIIKVNVYNKSSMLSKSKLLLVKIDLFSKAALALKLVLFVKAMMKVVVIVPHVKIHPTTSSKLDNVLPLMDIVITNLEPTSIMVNAYPSALLAIFTTPTTESVEHA